MTWTGQTFSVGQILTAAQMNNLQADITALANGDAGAPTIDPINAMDHQGAAGAIGTYVWAIPTTTTVYDFGDTIAGGSLSPCGIRTDSAGPDNVSVIASGTLSGTWRCMGYSSYAAISQEAATSWLRIS